MSLESDGIFQTGEPEIEESAGERNLEIGRREEEL